MNLDVKHTNAHMKKIKAISVRVPEPLKKAVEKSAKDDGRSLASMVQKILTEKMQSTGYLK